MAILQTKEIMAKRQTAIVDIGSYSIVTLIGERGVNNTFKILGKGEVSYDGFSNGKFFSPKDLKNVIGMCISNAEEQSGCKVTEVCVGIPGEFCLSYCSDVTLNFDRRKKVREADVKALIHKGIVKRPTYSLINHSAIYYMLDDGKRIIDPLNKPTTSISSKVSYVMAENNFLDFVTRIFSELGIRHVMYISANLAEMMYLVEPTVRDRYAILVDIGYMTTNVMVGQGDGLLFLNSFSLGGGHITGDLYQVLNIPFIEAESLKHKIVLNWDAKDSDTYEVMGKEFINTYSAKATNEITEARLEVIASYILKCLDRCEYEVPDYLPIYLTGGGVCYIKGVKDFMARKLGRKVEIIAPRLADNNRPDFSSEIALLDLAINLPDNDYNLIYSK